MYLTLDSYAILLYFNLSTRYDSRDSGHEDTWDMEQDADNNDSNFPNVSLFSVAMMMMKKVHIVN